MGLIILPAVSRVRFIARFADTIGAEMITQLIPTTFFVQKLCVQFLINSPIFCCVIGRPRVTRAT